MTILYVAIAILAILAVALFVVEVLDPGDQAYDELDERQAEENTRPHAHITVTRKSPE